MTAFAQLFESVPDAMIVVDENGRIESANRNAARLFGYPDGGLNGLFVERLMPGDVRELHRAHRRDYMRAPRVRSMGGDGMVLVGLKADGQQFPAEIALSPLQRDGRSCYLASIRDITESLRAKQALRRAKYDAVIGRIGRWALASPVEGDVIKAAAELLSETLALSGVAVLLLRGRRPVRLVGTASIHAIEESAWSALSAGPLESALRSRLPLVVHDAHAGAPNGWPPGIGSGAIVALPGRERPMGALLALDARPRRFEHDALQLLQNVGNLIASWLQRRGAEEELAHSQRLDAIGRLTGGIAHDFNNMLAIASCNLQMLDGKLDGQPDAHRLVRNALHAVERGAQLTSKLLSFSRRQQLAPQAIDPRFVLEELGLMLGTALGDAIRLDLHCDVDVPHVLTDPSQLDHALVNLALNARDAMPDGGTISIRASKRTVHADPNDPGLRPGEHVCFSVSDTGSGMAPDVLTRACEPFFTTKASGQGSGLGLSTIYGFVRQSGGRLQIDSAPGAGTRVEFCLPAGIDETASG